MDLVQILHIVDSAIAVVFLVCYAYQFVYIPVAMARRNKQLPPPTDRRNNFAVLICARNEEVVIGDLLDSLRAQTYDAALIHPFVMADNCTDGTAQVAREHGALVYERQNREQVGKGYALQALLRHLQQDYPDGFDGYFVFDADNVLRPDYIEQMNRTFVQGYLVVTSYRNSKNFGDSWISAGNALWFLRESRYLNHARHLLGVSCAVSGTGFMFSRQIAEEIGDWPFHMLTEDIEFSACQIVQGRKIGFCAQAELFDEQPVTFAQSWRQRMRWAKGYVQVVLGYGGRMLKGAFKGSFSCFDMFMNIAPAYVLSILSVLLNVVLIVLAAVAGQSLLYCLLALGRLALALYNSFFLIGLITVITEWKHIHTTPAKKILYAFTFPVFMLTYVPISLLSLFKKVQWKHIEHTVSMGQLKQRRKAAEDISDFVQ